MKDRIQEIEQLIQVSNQRFSAREALIRDLKDRLVSIAQETAVSGKVEEVQEEKVQEETVQEETVQEGKVQFCSQCGSELPLEVKFCKYCGHRISETKPKVLLCTCGRELKPGTKFCRYCGATVRE